jgi:hypothetical protein
MKAGNIGDKTEFINTETVIPLMIAINSNIAKIHESEIDKINEYHFLRF